MNNIQWIYEHPENSGCKLIKKQAELVWRLWAKDRLFTVMGSIYMNSKSGFVPAIRNLRQTITCIQEHCWCLIGGESHNDIKHITAGVELNHK